MDVSSPSADPFVCLFVCLLVCFFPHYISQWKLGLEDSENVSSWLSMVSSCKQRSQT